MNGCEQSSGFCHPIPEECTRRTRGKELSVGCRTKMKLTVQYACIVAFACAVFLMGCHTVPTQTPDAKVRCDGIYRAPPAGWYPDTTPGAVPSKTGFASYLRFYPDDTVLSVGSGDDSEQVAAWFKRGREDIGSGQYHLNGARLQFTTKSKWGAVDYTGEVTGDGLKLKWLSHINGRSGQDSYVFVKVAVTGANGGQ